MIKQEFVIVGCVLIVIGLAFCYLGYEKSQPTLMDSAVSLLEDMSGEKAPDDIRSDKSEAYAMMGGGAVSLIIGMGFILKSRTEATTTDRKGE